MDKTDLIRRVSEAMMRIVEIGDDGVARVSDQFKAMRDELMAALAVSGDDPDLAGLARQLGDMEQAVSNPRVAAAMAESMSAAAEPQPEIFDIIEIGDVAAIWGALETVDVNARHGRFDKTALYHAITNFEGASLDVITLLLDAGADPRLGLTNTNVLHGFGFANLRGVAPEDLAHVIRRCVDLGADLEERTNNLRWTPLITAASEWNEIATEALLMAGADVHARAGDVEGVFGAGADSLTFAEGHAPTMAVLRRYLTPN